MFRDAKTVEYMHSRAENHAVSTMQLGAKKPWFILSS